MAEKGEEISRIIRKSYDTKLSDFITVKHLYLVVTESWRYWHLRQRVLKYMSANICFSVHLHLHSITDAQIKRSSQ